MMFNTLQDVFAEQLNDLRSAEQQLVKALPKLVQAAGTDELRRAFEDHLEQTRGHLERIEDLLATTGTAVLPPLRSSRTPVHTGLPDAASNSRRIRSLRGKTRPGAGCS